MALFHSDGFDSHAAAATLADGDPNWGAQVGVAVTAAAGRFGGNSLRLAASTVGSVAFAAVGAVNVAFAGWFKVDTLTNPVPLIADSTGPLVTLNVDRSVTVKDGAGTTRTTLPAGSVPVNTWVWLEASYRSGGVTANIGGIPLGTPYVGAYTAPAVASLKLLNSAGTGVGQIDVDDFVVWDDSGSYFNAYGLAPRRIQLLRPSANGTPVQWTPGGATNWQSVDAASWAGGAGVEATTNGQKDRYAFTDLAATPGAVDAVVVKTRVFNAGTDPATLAHVASTGGSETSSTPQSVSTVAPGVLRSAFYRDALGAAWTASTVNAAEFGQTLGV